MNQRQVVALKEIKRKEKGNEGMASCRRNKIGPSPGQAMWKTLMPVAEPKCSVNPVHLY